MKHERFYDERLSPQQNKACEMALNGFCIGEIADELDVSHSHVSAVLCCARKRGVEVWAKRTPRAWPSDADLLAMQDRGLTYEQIALRTGKKIKNIGVRLHKARKAAGRGPSQKYRPRIPFARLCEWQALRRRGLSLQEIANRHGITRSAVWGALRRAALKQKKQRQAA